MKRKPGIHTDEGFAHGFGRHFVAQLISDSGSFEDLFSRLKRSKDEKYELYLFNELKFLNLVFLIQWVIPEIIGYAYGANQIKNEEGLQRVVIRGTEQCWKINTQEAQDMLEKETEGNSTRIYTPHAMLYVAGLGLGELIHILRNHVQDPLLEKDVLIPWLENTNIVRNYLLHIPFSSRFTLHEEIAAAMEGATRASENLKETLSKQMKRAKQIS